MPNKKQNHKNPKRKIDKCCEKCYTTYTNDDYPIRKTTDACLNPNCECHKSQPSKREIEKEKVSCKDCRFEKDGYCESFDDEIAVMSIAIMNFDIECTNFEPKSQPPTDDLYKGIGKIAKAKKLVKYLVEQGEAPKELLDEGWVNEYKQRWEKRFGQGTLLGWREEHLDFIRTQVIKKEIRAETIKEIEGLIKERTLQNKYRDGETAFDIVQDLNKLK